LSNICDLAGIIFIHLAAKSLQVNFFRVHGLCPVAVNTNFQKLKVTQKEQCSRIRERISRN
ncbi:hypothetical protein, partial [Parasutterella excrementihominis]|uniref:hypothetical protein n=1 Tax=Parasutterella excrementihominis TaxID=487175 RepID=UPI003AAE6819